jgi:hypothetical protein
MPAAHTTTPQPGYSTARVWFDLSKHLHLAFLREKGPEHRKTKSYLAQARRSAAHLIAAGL